MMNFEDMIQGLQKDMKIPDDVRTKYEETLSKLPENRVTKKKAIE